MALPPPWSGFLLDLHASCAGNPHLPYVELYPYLDSLWFGEQCEYAAPRHATLRHATSPPRRATYGCSPHHLRLPPATSGCRYAGYSPDEWLAEVSGVPFGLPAQALTPAQP